MVRPKSGAKNAPGAKLKRNACTLAALKAMGGGAGVGGKTGVLVLGGKAVKVGKGVMLAGAIWGVLGIAVTLATKVAGASSVMRVGITVSVTVSVGLGKGVHVGGKVGVCRDWRVSNSS